MKRVGFVAVAVFAAACGGSAQSPLTSGTPPQLVAASPSPVASPVQPIVLSGTNSKVTDPLEIPPGNYRVSWQAAYHGQYSGTNFIVHIQGQSKVGLVNVILPNPDHGEVLFSSAGGSFILEVQTDSATWTITFTWLSPP